MIAVDIWQGLADVPADLGPTVVTIGVFDGVHRGHRKLIETAVTRAHQLGLPCVLMTFDPHPLAVVAPAKMPPMLGAVSSRAELAEQLGVDHILAVKFTPDLAGLSPEDFFERVLLQTLHARAIAVGENFTFGHKAAGTTETLRGLGERSGVEVDVVPLLEDEGVTLSSTYIRGRLAEGDVERAGWALGRPYSVAATVERGAGRGGRELGYPTANMYFPESTMLPADGVYAGWFTILEPASAKRGEQTGEASAGAVNTMRPGTRYPAAISVGTNPTFGDAKRSVESYVLDEESDLYGARCQVDFVGHVRQMETFHGVDELLKAMAGDVRRTKEILGVS